MKSWHIDKAASFVSLFCLGLFLALATDYGLHSVFGILTGFGVILAFGAIFYGLVEQVTLNGWAYSGVGMLLGVMIAFGSVDQGYMVLFLSFSGLLVILSAVTLWLNAEGSQTLEVMEATPDEQ
jgi:hypothetical protein